MKYSWQSEQPEQKKCDRVLILVLVIIIVTGLVILYSTSAYNGEIKFQDTFYYLKKQIFATLLGIMGMWCIANIDYHIWKKWAVSGYLLSILLGVLVMLFGEEYNGSKRWLSFGPFSFQPSEFAKVAVILFLTYIILKNAKKMWKFSTICKIVISVLPIVGLVGASNLSTAVIILGIAVIMVFVASPKYGQFAWMVCLGCAFMGIFLAMESYRLERLQIWQHPVEAGRYRLVWAKLCHWSNRASIVRELLGLDEAISVNMVEHADHEKNLGWEFVYDKDNVDPVLDIQFLSEAYYKADDDYTGRTTVPALIDVKTGKVVNNDYHKLTNYFEVDFKPFHKKNAPDLYPEELRKDIDKMNDWLFDNINNGVYKTTFCRSKEAYWDAYNSFYAAMDLLEERLENQRFLFGDYVTDSDVRLYVTLARLDIRYTHQLGHTKHPLFTYKNLWGYARDLYQIPAFKNNTYFKDFANPDNKKHGRTFESFNARFLDEIDFDAYWGAPHNRARLSSDPGNKFKTEKQD